jgi:hypothetical protein
LGNRKPENRNSAIRWWKIGNQMPAAVHSHSELTVGLRPGEEPTVSTSAGGLTVLPASHIIPTALYPSFRAQRGICIFLYGEADSSGRQTASALGMTCQGKRAATFAGWRGNRYVKSSISRKGWARRPADPVAQEKNAFGLCAGLRLRRADIKGRCATRGGRRSRFARRRGAAPAEQALQFQYLELDLLKLF